jgi:hypothetical protein
VRAAIFLVGIAECWLTPPQFGGTSIVGNNDRIGIANIDCRRKDFDKIRGMPVWSKAGK